MRRNIFIMFLALLIGSFAFAQDHNKYNALVQEAHARYEKKEYAASAQKYKEAFDVLNGKAYPTDRYNAACSYALAKNADTAFYHLFRLANDSKYKNISHLTTDADLKSLHKDKRWSELTAQVKANKQKAEANLDKPLAAKLDSIREDDQKYRQMMDSIEAKHGWKSPEMQSLFKTMHEKDSINVIKVSKILDERGWLGAEIVGEEGNSTLFLVIQHGDQATQEKYLPMMREAVKKGNAQASSLALLEDRLALRQGKRQIYGSQVTRDPVSGEYYVLPLEDPDNVDKRRAEVGLGKLQDYISTWGMTWDAEAYKKKLPEYEAKQKK